MQHWQDRGTRCAGYWLLGPDADDRVAAEDNVELSKWLGGVPIADPGRTDSC